jgi:diguanylate cyclase (GGDEF)-like protein
MAKAMGARPVRQARQAVTTLSSHTHETRVAPAEPCLVVLDGPRLGECVNVHGVPVVIGRDPQADFQLPHPSVSRRHCAVWFEHGLTWIRDLRSKNGLVINGHRISRALLNEGDHIRLGDVVLKVASGRVEARYHQALFGLATRDTLTGLLNRRRFREVLDEAVGLASRGGSIAVAIVDIDHFKPVNDRLGHDAGDTVLQAIAAQVQALLRPGEAAGRLGGDEFALVLREGVDAARERCEALRATIEQLHGELPDGGDPVTLSIGVAGGGGRGASELLKAADRALLAAKAAGRNAVRVAG